MLTALRPAGSSPSTMLTVAKRALNATSGQFMPFNPDLQTVRELPEDRIQIQNVNRLDGQYIILVTQPKAVGESKFWMISNEERVNIVCSYSSGEHYCRWWNGDLKQGLVVYMAYGEFRSILADGKKPAEMYISHCKNSLW